MGIELRAALDLDRVFARRQIEAGAAPANEVIEPEREFFGALKAVDLHDISEIKLQENLERYSLTVDELEWKGPEEGFEVYCERLNAGPMTKRALAARK